MGGWTVIEGAQEGEVGASPDHCEVLESAGFPVAVRIHGDQTQDGEVQGGECVDRKQGVVDGAQPRAENNDAPRRQVLDPLWLPRGAGHGDMKSASALDDGQVWTGLGLQFVELARDLVERFEVAGCGPGKGVGVVGDSGSEGYGVGESDPWGRGGWEGSRGPFGVTELLRGAALGGFEWQ